MASDVHPSMPITPELIRNLASVAGLELAMDRAATLAPQAEQQFALMRTLDHLDPGPAEPMGVCRLDRQGDSR